MASPEKLKSFFRCENLFKNLYIFAITEIRHEKIHRNEENQLSYRFYSTINTKMTTL